MESKRYEKKSLMKGARLGEMFKDELVRGEGTARKETR